MKMEMERLRNCKNKEKMINKQINLSNLQDYRNLCNNCQKKNSLEKENGNLKLMGILLVQRELERILKIVIQRNKVKTKKFKKILTYLC